MEDRFELIASAALLSELHDVLARPKFRRWASSADAADFVAGLAEAAVVIDDPAPVPGVSPDPGDDYLVALARSAGADCLVSGDTHLTGLPGPDPSVLTPREFLERLGT